jgi:DNA gyrase subunit A
VVAMAEIRDKIIEVNINDEMKKSYIDYAMSVIVSRALPDVRDGLKPVHRRILYAIKELGFTYDKPHRKSARIVGDVLGKYHPHGDQSVYNAMVRMAQDFSIRYELIDGHGNFGSIDGDSAAAMRYTEARMTKLAGELLKDIDKETVDFVSNFDDSASEPSVLPSRFPNLLVNGSNGIAVGMATSIPPHNLNEVIDAIIYMIDNDEADVEDLIEIVKGPDFPTGAQILGLENIRNAYRTGRGRAVIRSKASVEEMKNGKSSIIVTEIPYQINKSKMLENIAALVRNKRIEGITDLRDESNREGIRIVIELRRDVNPNIILNKLYKHTQLQTTFSMISIALVNNEPKVLNLYEILDAYINHQKEVETRKTKYELRKAEERAHILEGYRIALDNIDRIIEVIRGSKDVHIAKDALIQEFGLSETQAKAILEMRLQRLTGLERDKIEAEYKELLDKINWFNTILSDETVLMGIIRNDLIEIKEKYGDVRKTELTFSEEDFEMEDLIEEKEVTITLTQRGYIKRVPQDIYQAQNRGGRGKTGLSTRQEDVVVNIFNTSTHANILYFTNQGRVYMKKAYKIPETTRTARGIAIVNLIQLNPGEYVTAVKPVREFDDRFIVMVTKNGIIKRLKMKDLDTTRKTGIYAINFRDTDDELVGVRITSGSDDILIATNNGKAIRFCEDQVRVMGRTAYGVIGISLENDDFVRSMVLVRDGLTLLTVTENGFGKRTHLEEYRSQVRGGKGMLTYSINDKTGNVVDMLVVAEADEILLVNTSGLIIRLRADEISVIGRNTSGVILMKTDDETKVVSLAKAIELVE